MLLCCHLSEPLPSGLLDRAMALLPPARREKSARLPERSRGTSVAAGLLLRWALQQSGCTATVHPTESGRPMADVSPPFLSLSHSGCYAVCALGDRPIGVDVQRITSVSSGLFSRVCTEAERAALARSSDAAGDFIRLWALKESYYKAAGNGDTASLPMMRGASFTLPMRRRASGTAVTGPDGWDFVLRDLADGYVLAVCARR